MPNTQKKNLSKFKLLLCLEEYFKGDHDQALLLTSFIWNRKDTILTNQLKIDELKYKKKDLLSEPKN